MLVLSRRAGERIKVGENIWVTIIRIGPNHVRIGFDAPDEVNIVREELLPASVVRVQTGVPQPAA